MNFEILFGSLYIIFGSWCIDVMSHSLHRESLLINRHKYYLEKIARQCKEDDTTSIQQLTKFQTKLLDDSEKKNGIP